MSWNRIYRPKQIAQLHNTAVREYFLSLLTAGALPQVFLFTGPKGIGKTSTARILAALVNDPANQAAIQKIFFTKEKNTLPLKEPSLENDLTRRIFEGSSFVVTELDAASNRGIDDIRALKERISLPPQEGSMAVYILDEVHMLTTEAFNALLKILEEPPAHVIFILATTELEKIPPTIISRAQIIRFTQATDTEILAALSAIVTAEKLEAEPEALELIVNQSEGSFRDAVKLLEMVAQVGPITQKATTELLFGAIKQTAPVLVTKLLEKDQEGIVALFQTLSAQQANPKLLHTQLLTYLHHDLLQALGAQAGAAAFPAKTTLFLLKEFSDPSLSAACPLPLLPLELKFLEIIERSNKKSTPQSEPPTPAKAHPPLVERATETKRPAVEEQVRQTIPDLIPTTSVSDSIPTPTTTLSSYAQQEPGNGQAIYDNWLSLVNQAATENFGLATLLKAARPISGELGKVTVSVFYTFHQEQLEQPKFRKMIDTLFSKVAGGPIQLECILEKPKEADLVEVSAPDTLAQLATASLM